MTGFEKALTPNPDFSGVSDVNTGKTEAFSANSVESAGKAPTAQTPDAPEGVEALRAELRALSKVIVDHLGGGSEWFKQIGEDYYVSASAIEGELRRRKTDAQITKRALIRANSRAALTKARGPQ